MDTPTLMPVVDTLSPEVFDDVGTQTRSKDYGTLRRRIMDIPPMKKPAPAKAESNLEFQPKVTKKRQTHSKKRLRYAETTSKDAGIETRRAPNEVSDKEISDALVDI